MARSRAEQVVAAYESAKSEAAAHRALVSDCARFFGPEMDDLKRPAEGAEVVQPNTSWGILMQQKCAAGLYSNTVSMGRGNLESSNPKLRKVEAVRRFYGEVGTVTNEIIMESFPVHYQELLPDYLLGGRGVVYVGFDPDHYEHYFRLYNPQDCFFFENARGRIDTCYRGFQLTARQAVQEFGEDAVSEQVKKDAADEGKCQKKHEFIHCMRPRKKRKNARKDAQNMAFESLTVEVGSKKLVKESGAHRFRYVAPRCFVKRGESNGRSPAMQALYSMRALVRGTDDYFDAVEMGIRPTLILPDEDAVEDAVLEPGEVLFADMTKGAPFQYGGQIDPRGLEALREEQKQEVRDLHFVDLFQVLEQFKAGAKTAYEVSQIVAEKIHMIAPLINRLKRECFAPLFEIVAEDVMEHGLVEAEIPNEVAGDLFRVRYTSRIDSTINGVETENLLLAISEAVQVETAMQGGLYTGNKMKVAEIVERILESRNVDPSLYEDAAKTKRKVDAMLKQQAQAAEAEQMQGAVKPLDLQKGTDEGSPLKLIESAQQSAAV